jgi:hypothetical protein
MSDMVVGPDAFREWIAPYVAAIRDFATAIDAVPERYGGLPTIESRAMSDRAEEQNYRTRTSWDQPIADTHMFGAMTLRAASDYVQGLAELFDSRHPPLYAHLTLARAALESAVVSAWLSDPCVTSVERIKRGLCEMLYSANEVNELQLDSNGRERVEFWKDVGAGFGWTINNSRTKPVTDGTRRPRISDGIVDLIGRGGDSRVGDLLYSRLSAVDHVTWFGLFSALEPNAAVRDERARTATVPITVDGAQVSAYVYYVIKVVRAAAQIRFTLMGWLDEPWGAAATAAGAIEEQLLRMALASRSRAAGPVPDTDGSQGAP